jgi:hypothetical protein
MSGGDRIRVKARHGILNNDVIARPLRFILVKYAMLWILVSITAMAVYSIFAFLRRKTESDVNSEESAVKEADLRITRIERGDAD